MIHHILDTELSEQQARNHEQLLMLVKAQAGAANDNHTLWAGLPDIGAMLLVLLAWVAFFYVVFAGLAYILEYVFMALEIILSWIWK